MKRNYKIKDKTIQS